MKEALGLEGGARVDGSSGVGREKLWGLEGKLRLGGRKLSDWEGELWGWGDALAWEGKALGLGG